MKPDWQTTDGAIRLHKGDCREVLKSFPAEMFTACVTDPPYELGFMGRKWDSSGVAFQPATWAAVMRVLKPGAHLLAFGGTRTYHRICCAIEDAGFEIRDCIMWIYGSGFPKSFNVSKAMDKAAGIERPRVPGGVGSSNTESLGEYKNGEAISDEAIGDEAKVWQGYGTALKPAYEPIIVARKPLPNSMIENCRTHGCGPLNIDGCRVAGETPSVERRKHAAPGESIGSTGWTTPARPESYNDQKPGEQLGRWPANVIHDGSEEVLAGFPESKDGVAGARTGTRNGYEGGWGAQTEHKNGYGGGGNAARFFYCAKASKSDRGADNKHPTVKPQELMQYLVKLVTMPSGNLILDPFAGSGTTLLACYNEFVEAVGIDLEVDHLEIMERRAKGEIEKTPLFNESGKSEAKQESGPTSPSPTIQRELAI